MNQISSNIVKLRALRKANCRELWPLIGLSRCVRVHNGPPSIFVNIAAMINETASTSHWYWYLENVASSLSARHNIYIRSHVFARHNLEQSYHIMLTM